MINNVMKMLFTLVACHMIGDYLFQTDFIANTKGKNWYHLLVHCVLYAVPFYLVFGWSWRILFLAAIHFPIDALKARYGITNYGQDQMIHFISLVVFL